jgi:hypothetical protein
MVDDGGMWRPASAVIPVAATGQCLGVVARDEPFLRPVAHLKIVGRTAAAHVCRHPARIDGVAQHLGTQTGYGCSECRDEELAVVVGPWSRDRTAL